MQEGKRGNDAGVYFPEPLLPFCINFCKCINIEHKYYKKTE